MRRGSRKLFYPRSCLIFIGKVNGTGEAGSEERGPAFADGIVPLWRCQRTIVQCPDSLYTIHPAGGIAFLPCSHSKLTTRRRRF